MTRTHDQSSQHTNQSVRLAAAGAVAGILALAGCASAGQGAVSASAGSASASASTHATSTAAAGTSGAAASDPSTALGTWLADVIDGRYQKACTEMIYITSAAQTASPPVAASSDDCADITKPIVNGQSMQSLLKSLHTAFAPAGSATPATVEVAPVSPKGNSVSPKGNSVTVDAKQITVDGERLDLAVLSRSTGIKPGQLDISFQLDEIGGAWYVAEFTFDI